MWAVFRYSTGTIFAYFNNERDAELYVKDQSAYDTRVWELTHAHQNLRPPAPDWGYKMHVTIDQLCNGLDD